MPTSITSNGITFDDATTLTTGVVPTANIANAAVTPAKLSQPLTLATSVATTSGTSIDFTGIPSWVKRITVMLNGVSTNGTSNLLIRLGTSSGVVSSGYVSSSAQYDSSTTAISNDTSGFIARVNAAAASVRGHMTIALIGGAQWVASHTLSPSTTQVITGAGSVDISQVLDRVRLTTVNGSDAFDAGSVSIIYEG